MWIVFCATLGLWYRYLSHRFDGRIPGSFFVQFAMESDRLGDLLADRVYRIKRCHWVLKDHRDIVAADPSHSFSTRSRQLFALELYRSANDLSRRRDQAHYGKGGDR